MRLNQTEDGTIPGCGYYSRIADGKGGAAVTPAAQDQFAVA
jgi:hypothetical protein